MLCENLLDRRRTHEASPLSCSSAPRLAGNLGHERGRTVVRAFDKIMRQLDWPPIYLVSTAQFESVDGDRLMGDFGIASADHPIITVRRGLKGKILANTLWHEIGHKLFPSRRHWWIDAFGEKMARGGGMGSYCKKYGHSVDDLPPRAELLRLARLAARRMKRQTWTTCF